MNNSSGDKAESDEKKSTASNPSSIPTRPEDTDASGDALNGTGEDNHVEKKR